MTTSYYMAVACKKCVLFTSRYVGVPKNLNIIFVGCNQCRTNAKMNLPIGEETVSVYSTNYVLNVLCRKV